MTRPAAQVTTYRIFNIVSSDPRNPLRTANSGVGEGAAAGWGGEGAAAEGAGTEVRAQPRGSQVWAHRPLSKLHTHLAAGSPKFCSTVRSRRARASSCCVHASCVHSVSCTSGGARTARTSGRSAGAH